MAYGVIHLPSIHMLSRRSLHFGGIIVHIELLIVRNLPTSSVAKDQDVNVDEPAQSTSQCDVNTHIRDIQALRRISEPRYMTVWASDLVN